MKNLVDSLSSNSTNGPCCFQSRNITVVNRPFETNTDPIPAIKDIFVSLCISYCCSLVNSITFLKGRGVVVGQQRNFFMSHTLFVDLESEKKPNRIFESYPIGTMETCTMMLVFITCYCCCLYRMMTIGYFF